ncbi:MAG TPA: hypothetical protein VFH44_09830 [Solirubrobacterales bacterium]|nr:hypothetical protein [Solirubrobacterales bacterium]
MNAKANVEAIRDRIAGQEPSRFRAVVMAGTAGAGVAVAVYKLLRDPA